MTRVGLIMPDGVGIRNFALGPFLRQASERGPVHALHAVPERLLPHYAAELNGKVQWHPLLPYRERPLTFVLRSCLSYSQMYWVDNGVMRYNRSRPVRGSWRTRTVIHVARLTGRAAAFPRGIRALDRLHAWAVKRLPEVEHYRRLFEQIKPSVLFCSHQRPAEILAPVLAAGSLGIPTATFIFSWDNLTSKGRIAAPFDHYLVWSEHMRGELLRYYPDITAERVHVVGTPQFDPYGDETLLWSRQVFCRQLGIEPSRPLICYSGGDASNSLEDPGHVRTLLELIRAGKIRGKPHVVLRPAPVDDGQRYALVRRDFPELIYAQPAWLSTKVDNWAAVIPLKEDLQFLANLTHHADLNINFGSTMTLDFAIRDKPVINVAFDVSDPAPFGMPMWDYYQLFEHYRPVIELGAARFARSSEELAQYANAYLADPSLDREPRRHFVDLEVSLPVGASSQRILAVLERIAR